jgi:hypothetical protein
MVTEDQGLTIGPSLDTLTDDFNSEGFYEHNANPAPTPEPAPAAESKLFAGKYKTAEDMEAAYVALSKKLGAPKPPADPAPKMEDKPAAKTEAEIAAEAAADALLTPEELAAKEAEQVAADAEAAKPSDGPAINIEALTAEYTADGELSEASLASLEKLGVGADVAGLFFQGVEAIKTLRTSEIATAAGSAEDLSAIVEWGTVNLDAASQKAFNDAVETAINQGDMAAIKLIIPAIKAQMNSGEPAYLETNGRGIPPATQGYASQSDMAVDMRDRRYSTDAAFVAQVQARLRATTAF